MREGLPAPTWHVSHVTCHVSCVTCHIPHVMCHRSHVTCHMTHVTCHMSHVTSHMSCVTFLCEQSGETSHGGSVINGATPSSFWLCWLKSHHLLFTWNVHRTSEDKGTTLPYFMITWEMSEWKPTKIFYILYSLIVSFELEESRASKTHGHADACPHKIV